jgi:purine catabolism regulator
MSRARREAGAAGDAAAARGVSTLRFGQTGDVGLSGLLGAERMRAYAELRLAPLRRSPSPGGEGGDDVRVLSAWLRHHAQGDPAARELGIHRHTLRKRLARIAGALEVDLESPTVRAELSLTCQALGPDRG